MEDKKDAGKDLQKEKLKSLQLTLDKLDKEFGKKMFNAHGYLSMEQDGNDVTGLSIMEFKTYPGPDGISSAAVMMPFTDVVVSSGQTGKKISFSVEHKGLITENTAELSADGKTLSGVSRQEIVNDAGIKETMHYTWVAKRR